MCAAQLHGGALHGAPHPCSSRHAASSKPCVSAGRSSLRARPVTRLAANWKVFGPTAEYSDGDADYYNTTARLADQYEWFAPGREGSAEAEEEQQREDAEFGLSPRQIAALGLSGPRSSMPDPVSVRADPCSTRRRARSTVVASPALCLRSFTHLIGQKHVFANGMNILSCSSTGQCPAEPC